MSPRWTPSWAAAFLLLGASTPVVLAGDGPVPNYRRAAQFEASKLRPFVYDTSVQPRWIGKTDSFWYSFRTAEGTNFLRVNPALGTKEPLFDRAKLAMLVTEAVQKPYDPATFNPSRLELDDEGTKLKFVVADLQFEYNLTTEALTKLGKAPAAPAAGPGGPPGGRGNGTGNGNGNGNGERREEGNRQQNNDGENRQNDGERREQGQGQGQDNDAQRNATPPPAGGPGNRGAQDRLYSPDRKTYVFARRHNLYIAEVGALKAEADAKAKAEADKKAADEKAKAEAEKKAADEKAKAEAEAREKSQAEVTKSDPEPQDEAKKEEKKDEAKKDEAKKDEVKKDEKKDGDKAEADKPKDEAKKDEPKKEEERRPRDEDDRVTQLTTDGADKYSFGGADDDKDDKKSRPRGVTWAADSKSFHVTRRDSRSVKELFLVNSLATPRPTLEKYPYPLPGEEGINATELFYYSPAKKAMVKVEPKWRQEGYTNIHWGKTGEELRFVRIDRLVRHVELCALNLTNGESKVLIAEGFENAPLNIVPVRYVGEAGDEMIWWSERSGWGHFYLYSRDGKLKNAITSGAYRAGAVVEVDVENRKLYFTGNGREAGENPNFNHLYSVQLDGKGLALLDPGAASHRSSLSPSRQFVVDNASKIDAAPTVTLRKADGSVVMPLETADLSHLEATGWKLPETFRVKAADGVTDLYGNLWKPFDFDPKKKYPIIVHVYPGPQQEGTTHTFTPLAGEQALAQIGFIVIQVGHRGGTPVRSKAYASYGYFNLRDYGLADKKHVVEELALLHPFIDVTRVGIYGHSGGGFMTAAALMQKPYNEFFKVGVSSSGNHDNNVYGAYWAERYHGLKEVAADDDKAKASPRTNAAGGRGGNATGARAGRPGEDDDLPVMDGLDDRLGLGNDPGLGLESDPEDGFFADVDEDEGDPQDAAKEQGQDVKETAKAIVKDVVDKVAKATNTKFDIAVPTNAELAGNLKGRLLLVHGEMDNNVHPAGTMRLVDALIKANKRFDMLILPGKRHGYDDYQPYFTQRMWEYFAEHLLGDVQPGADILDKAAPSDGR